jgi:hypothetical protein
MNDEEYQLEPQQQAILDAFDGFIDGILIFIFWWAFIN